MKTLVVGAVAALSLAALTLSLATPAEADHATPTPVESTAPVVVAPSPSTQPAPVESTTPAPADWPTPTEPVTADPAPVPLPEPALTITCTTITLVIVSAPNSGRYFTWAEGRAEKGTPKFLPVTGPLPQSAIFGLDIDPGQATAWIMQIRSVDGTVVWSRSGTTVPCAPEPRFKYTSPCA